jgi:hypothetical protein
MPSTETKQNKTERNPGTHRATESLAPLQLGTTS